jgi:hypothetical protein
MAFEEERKVVEPIVEPVVDEDDAALRALGYVPSFKREFSNISTVSLMSSIYLFLLYEICSITHTGTLQISFAFSIMVSRQTIFNRAPPPTPARSPPAPPTHQGAQ